MSFVVIVRGPLGIGKTTISRRLADALGAKYISIDQILEEEGLWVRGRLAEFLRANEFAATRAARSLAQGVPVVLDGNFYWKGQVRDLIARLGRPHFVFTLEAPCRTCIARDGGRESPYGPTAVREVYTKATAFRFGTPIDATRSIGTVVGEIVRRIRRQDPGVGNRPRGRRDRVDGRPASRGAAGVLSRRRRRPVGQG